MLRRGQENKIAIAAVAALFIVLLHACFNTSRAETKTQLPSSKLHPLPATLAQWKDKNNSGDYFMQVKPIDVGYLVWSRFPLRVYIQQPNLGENNSTTVQKWATTVEQAVREWNTYLPLVIVTHSETADIRILRSPPPLSIAPNEKFPRARSAQTSYELLISNNKLFHRCTILLSPTQTGKYLEAAARHEFGHALGIWGHSPVASDALYFSQVENPPPISARDINTLKRVYEQPTKLGWELPKMIKSSP